MQKATEGDMRRQVHLESALNTFIDAFRVDFSFIKCSIEGAESLHLDYMLIGEPMSKYKMSNAYQSVYQ